MRIDFCILKVIFKISLLKVDIWKEMANIIISSEYSKNCRRNNWNIYRKIIIKFIEILYFL